MKNSLLIALREFRERIGSRSFVLFSLLGPLVVLGVIYLMFIFGGQKIDQWNVVIADPSGLLQNRIMPGESESITYSFADSYIQMEEFRDAKKFQQFDALIEINEKVVSNKVGHIFYRNEPTVRLQTAVKFHVERRIEELMVDEFTDFSIEDYLKIKQPLNLAFHDVYNPNNESAGLRGWVGFGYGILIFTFIFLFGMTILRSVSREKSNRIVEVVLASVSPKQMMLGKIAGIGLAAFIQFVIWMTIMGVGLYFMRDLLLADFADMSSSEKFLSNVEYNDFVNLIYAKIGFFFIFFIVGYVFYGALFAAIGSTMGSESDGQQFVLPLIMLLCFALYSGYYYMNFPESTLAELMHYLPFTSPVVVMVKVVQGYEPGHVYELYLSLSILIVGAILMLGAAGRLYKNGILQFGHRLRLRHLLKWLKKT